MLSKIKEVLGLAPKSMTMVKDDTGIYWVDSKGKQLSPTFTSENEAILWTATK